MDDLDISIVAKGAGALVVLACISVFGGFVLIGAVVAIVAVVILCPPPPRVTDE